MLLLWEEYINDFTLGSDVAGVAKSLLICGMRELLSVEKSFWFFNTLTLGELVWNLYSD